MVQRYNEANQSPPLDRFGRSVPMKFRALLLASIMGLLSLSVAVAQDDKQPSQTSSQTQVQQPASQPQAKDSKDKDKDKKEKKDKKYKHDGSKDDVDAIGNRHVGGLDWYSTETD